MSGVDIVMDIWTAAKQAGPFATMFLLYACYVLNDERKAERGKYDDMVSKFVSLAADTSSTLKDWRDVLTGPKVK